jgi:hypothetical protein
MQTCGSQGEALAERMKSATARPTGVGKTLFQDRAWYVGGHPVANFSAVLALGESMNGGLSLFNASHITFQNTYVPLHV